MATKRTSKPTSPAKAVDRTKAFVQINKLLLEPFMAKYRDDAMRDEMEGQVIATGIAIKQLDAKHDPDTWSLAKLELIKLQAVVDKAVASNPTWAGIYIDKKELTNFFSEMKKSI